MTWQKATARRMGSVVAGQVFGQALLGQRLPAADDFGGVVHLELVVFVLQQPLQAAVDVVFLDGQDDDLVIHQQARA